MFHLFNLLFMRATRSLQLIFTLVGALMLSAQSVAAKPRVVASIQPIHSIASVVMAGVGEPTLLVAGGGSPHDAALRPSQARALAKADVVFWVGPTLESFLVKSLATLGQNAHSAPLIETHGLSLQHMRRGGVWGEGHHHHHADHDAAHEDHDAHDHEAQEHADHDAHDHEAHEHEDHDEHDHKAQEHADPDHAMGAQEGSTGETAAMDPHIWLDPHNGAVMAAHMAAVLGKADPANAALYTENARRFAQNLAQWEAHARTRLAPLRGAPYLVFHDAYHAFEAHFGLTPVGAISISPERRPGAKRLHELRRIVQQRNARCLFSEPQFPSAIAQSVIEGSAARLGVLDPLGAELKPGPDAYLQLLDQLVESLTACLGAEAASH
ncbi:zinc ABC transporter substrate-binding protein [Magnetofaba australis]|nr:zinc ABC transporter substrate-binding protein [Magnetofaba australis]